MAVRSKCAGHIVAVSFMRLIALRMIALLIAGAAFVGATAIAQSNYPSRPVRIIVASEAGGGTDIVARILAERLRQSMGQPFIIENRPGAGGLIGIELSGRAPNDGYPKASATSLPP
jgi:tripartite-type tricarboxylate transporter receptor subunit TctC